MLELQRQSTLKDDEVLMEVDICFQMLAILKIR